MKYEAMELFSIACDIVISKYFSLSFFKIIVDGLTLEISKTQRNV